MDDDFDPYDPPVRPGGATSRRDPFRVMSRDWLPPKKGRPATPRKRVFSAADLLPETPREPHPHGALLRRGVYLSPFLSRRGFPVWFAVDSRHRSIKSMEVNEDRSEALVRRVLRGLLEREDGAPALRAV